MIREQSRAGNLEQRSTRPDQNRENQYVEERIIFIQFDEWIE